MRQTFWVRPGAAAAALALLGPASGSLGCGARTDVRQSSYLEDLLGPTNGGAGGIAGSNGANSPRTTVTGFDKVDILLVIDNSLGMADKQQVLGASIPQLFRRLTNPKCVAGDGLGVEVYPSDPRLACPAGTQREFAPLKDIHIGIITSSLGDFGGDTCPEEGAQNQAMNDHAQLLGALRRLAPMKGLPFMWWDPHAARPYDTEFEAQLTYFNNSLDAVTELGCGNEMPLEAMYRFLIDPKPPIDIVMTNMAANHRDEPDTGILRWRQVFLRPDSLVVVVILSDENDCSMRDDHYAWVPMSAGSGFRMWRGSSACEKDPNDPCCYSCMLDQFATEACKAKDTSCRQGDPASKRTMPEDDINMRCRRMKERFGIDLLFPPSRYVNALTLAELCPEQTYGDLDCNCTEAKNKGLDCDPKTASKVKNPLYQNLDPSVAPKGPLRPDAQAVYLTGIVGVPWQDLAVDYQAFPLQYRTGDTLDWDLFAPPVSENYATAELWDPFMIETSHPRTGSHPITGEPVSAPDAFRAANAINGHEWYTSDKDVEFACIFSLEALGPDGADGTRVCDLASTCGVTYDESDWFKICQRQFDSCRCVRTQAQATTPNLLDPTISHSPLCQDPWGQYGDRQYFAGAYPGLRQLQVLRGFHAAHSGNKSIVGSICPKDANRANSGSPEFGYNPTMNLLVDELREKLRRE